MIPKQYPRRVALDALASSSSLGTPHNPSGYSGYQTWPECASRALRSQSAVAVSLGWNTEHALELRCCGTLDSDPPVHACVLNWRTGEEAPLGGGAHTLRGGSCAGSPASSCVRSTSFPSAYQNMTRPASSVHQRATLRANCSANVKRLNTNTYPRRASGRTFIDIPALPQLRGRWVRGTT